MLESQQSSELTYLEANAAGGPKTFDQLMQDASQDTFVDITGVGGSLTMSQMGLPGGIETLSEYYGSATCPVPDDLPQKSV
jgi:hypothetical protein